MSEIGIGSTVWQNQSRIRVTCEREHWTPMKIIGETSRSWIVGPEWATEKIPKKGPRKTYWAMTEAEVDDAVYMAENRRRIADRVGQCGNPHMLREIARIVGYQPERSEREKTHV